MKSSVLIGLIGGALIGAVQFYSVMLNMDDGVSNSYGLFIHWLPQILYFMCIYMTVKLFTQKFTDSIPPFKDCLKQGGITVLIICLLWGIGFFVSLTHIDVQKDVLNYYKTGRGSEVHDFLSHVTRQNMFDYTKNWTLTNFLLGFAISVLVTVIFRMRRRPTQY